MTDENDLEAVERKLKYRCDHTGQHMKKPLAQYELILHDFGNLQLQILGTSEDKEYLEEMAENMNFLFSKAGHADQFEAQVTEVDL